MSLRDLFALRPAARDVRRIADAAERIAFALETILWEQYRVHPTNPRAKPDEAEVIYTDDAELVKQEMRRELGLNEDEPEGP